MFKEDCPISLLDDDKLNRREFAESLAQAILNHKKENCLTISLMGKWGSGKTSFMNLLRSILCEDRTSGNDRDPLYYGVWINMWEYSIMQTPEQTLIGVIKGMISECTRILEQRNPTSSVAGELKEKAWSFLKKTCAVVATTAVKAGVNTLGLDGEEAAGRLLGTTTILMKPDRKNSEMHSPRQLMIVWQDRVRDEDSCFLSMILIASTRKMQFRYWNC